MNIKNLTFNFCLPALFSSISGLVPQGMAYRIMEVQFVTGGLICPRRRHRVPTNIAIESGLIDQQTLGVLQNRETGDSYRQLFNSAQDDPVSGFRLLYVDSSITKVIVGKTKYDFLILI